MFCLAKSCGYSNHQAVPNQVLHPPAAGRMNEAAAGERRSLGAITKETQEVDHGYENIPARS